MGILISRSGGLRRVPLFIFSVVFGLSSSAHALSQGRMNAGISYYAMNSVGKITSKETGTTNFLGTGFFPFFIAYQMITANDIYFAPQFSFTAIPRKGRDGIRENLILIDFPFGGNIHSLGNLDWMVGPSIQLYLLEGEGGFKTLNNGGGTTTFAKPGRTAMSKNLNLRSGLAYNFETWKIAGDIYFSGLMSERRTINLSFSLGYLW